MLFSTFESLDLKIKINIDKVRIESIPERYTVLKNPEEINSEEITQFKNNFKEWIKNTFSTPFDEIPHIKQFKKSLKELPDLRIHYPRLNKDPKEIKESFKWFVANKKNKNGVRILPDIDFVEQQKLPNLSESRK